MQRVVDSKYFRVSTFFFLLMELPFFTLRWYSKNNKTELIILIFGYCFLDDFEYIDQEELVTDLRDAVLQVANRNTLLTFTYKR